ncbi:hypothetical protein HHL08_02795 [Sphingobium sp. AR-3-1]|uniref:Lipoprotein n=1 Tax=Sphingobium psychrophilum TaxID=2728834 RepID=A0A7X9ZR27_9SPHN|nr:hypothetical protein [Sphingobium psychrophilum]NML09082.1 hypothetical protein [Sphingobium psychrophilum]
MIYRIRHIIARPAGGGRGNFRKLCLIATLLLASGCSIIEPEKEVSFKITVRIDTPEGIVSNYSIWKVCIKDAWLSSAHGTISYKYFGQAIPITYKSRTVYGLLNSKSNPDLPVIIIAYLLNQQFPQRDWRKSWNSAFPRWKSEKRRFTLPKELYPLFVHFSDNKSLSRNLVVDGKSLSNALGKSVNIKDIYIEMVNTQSLKVHNLDIPKDTYNGLLNWRPGMKGSQFEIIGVSHFEKGPLE